MAKNRPRQAVTTDPAIGWSPSAFRCRTIYGTSRLLLDDTLVIWTGEFGRTPDNNKRGGVYSLGRGHNSQAMTMPLAGGGVRPGIVGATDELGSSAVDCVHPIRDLHVTLLHLLGLDDNKLTYFHGGRFKQLSQFGGQLSSEILI